MSLEKLIEKRSTIETQLQQRQKEIGDLQAQVSGAEATIRQWTDMVLIQRGQLIEIDAMIQELSPEDVSAEVMDEDEND